MASNPSINALTDAVLIDKALQSLQTHLETSLGWLTSAYGKAERRIRTKDGRTVIYPAVYADAKEYLAVFPDSHLGNFSFFDVRDGYTIDPDRKGNYKVDFDAGLVFWFDFRTVYPSDWEARTLQNVIEEVYNAFRTFADVQVKELTFGQIWEQSENIYSRYTRTEIENQYLMRPYGGFRLDFSIKYLEPCDPMRFEGVNYWIVEGDNVVQP